MKWYVGWKGNTYRLFRTNVEPNQAVYGHIFDYITGGFKSKQEAIQYSIEEVKRYSNREVREG